ncbi:hypothetical protein EV10_0004 [Prochlorococcus marinus str. SS51]|uniref:Uncharacterized protein n=1 Tax=Prochlorococcus marinus (strain SARG / CCMP1375 / SS120) TaxID=167539 RepID=Q7VCM6_PROMA|nr:Predicted protein [Prochlorococcus marinus subsp. marinus str. CCMP1375]KGG14467.1 hypothetical protein EV04_0044 [Prochlorococcus marinus str. LG]KGG22542.1 hypothetical protein EV08_0057 [Prochlorococcus marinus str. SS2]KGG24386.1 hypothetical protein EV09_0293 [Prochlorococcus marinus str. SS35]KGG34158.1 hypothetical protein EV10_0004 [Prochlorococcus marinus str. SS51]
MKDFQKSPISKKTQTQLFAKIKSQYSSDGRWAQADLQSSINTCLAANSYPSCPLSIK